MVNPDDLLNFIELGSFVASWEELGLADDDLAALQIELMSDPRQGPIVKETSGLRKLGFHRRGGRKERAARCEWAMFTLRSTVSLSCCWSIGRERWTTSRQQTENDFVR